MASRGVLVAAGCLLAVQVAVSVVTVASVKRMTVPPAAAPRVPVQPPAPLPPPDPAPAPVPAAVPVVSADLEALLRRVASEAAPALLHIENRKAGGLGSGFLIDMEGNALTNAHVVGEARDVRCMLFNGHKVTAKVLARDYAMDLALVRLDMRNAETAAYVKPLPLGDSSQLQVGHMVLALGSPHGLYRSMSFGMVSNAHRWGGVLAMPRGGIAGLMNLFIQTDAPINPGNSGGPLVTLDGKVVGVNSRGYPNADGLGMSIPIDTAKEVLVRLKAANEDGQVERAVIGADLGFFDPADDTCEWAYKLEQGVKVLCVFPDSPAEAAGLKKGDIITRIAGKPVGAAEEEDLAGIYRLIDMGKPGEPLEIEVQRPEAVTLKVSVLSSLAFYQSIKIPQIGLYARAPYDTEVRGQQGAVVTGRIEEFPGYDRNAQDQFQVGDIVKRVDGVAVRSFEAFHDQIRSAAGPVPAKLFEVIRGRKSVHIPFPYEKKGRDEGAE